MATNLFSPAAVKLFDMAHESRHQFCRHDFAEKRNFSEIPAKDSRAVGWSQEIARGKALRRAPSLRSIGASSSHDEQQRDR
jgi:hypothetical protein